MSVLFAPKWYTTDTIPHLKIHSRKSVRPSIIEELAMVIKEGIIVLLAPSQPHADNRWHYPQLRYNPNEGSLFIANDLWVMREKVLPTFSRRFIGNPSSIDEVTLLAYDDAKTVLWISNLPFGMLRWLKLSNQEQLPTGNIFFKCARQVHNGKESWRVSIPQLTYVRPHKGHSADRKSWRLSNMSWGRVVDCVAAAEVSLVEIINQFWPFVNFRSQPQDSPPVRLRIVFNATSDDIVTANHRVERLTKQDLLVKAHRHPEAFLDAWIPEGFIKTVLRLIALGYKPLSS